MKCYNERKTDDIDLPGNVAIELNINTAAAATSNAAVSAATSNEQISLSNLTIENVGAPLDECLVCSDAKRDTVFKVRREAMTCARADAFRSSSHSRSFILAMRPCLLLRELFASSQKVSDMP